MNFSIFVILAAVVSSCIGTGISHGTTLLGQVNSIGAHSLHLDYNYASGIGVNYGSGYGTELGYSGYGSGLGYSGYAGHKNIIAASPTVINTHIVHTPPLSITPSVLTTPTVLSTPAESYGNGVQYGLGWRNGVDGYVSYSGHGVAVKGPRTVPAVISGPSGKIVDDGLYGTPNQHSW